MSGSKGGPYGKGSIMTGAEMSRMTIESQGDLIDKLMNDAAQLRTELAAAQAATEAAEAEADHWRSTFHALLDDTKKRVRRLLNCYTEPEVGPAESEVADTAPSGH